MPPVEGVFLSNVLYHYSGEAGGGRDFIIGGNIVADLEAEILADFPTVLWTPTTDLGGATVALGAAIPFGRPDVTVSAVISGPFGQVGVRRTDDAFVVGDPILLGMVGVRQGDLHVQTFIEVPKRLTGEQERLLRDLAELEQMEVAPHRKSFLERIRDYFQPSDGESSEAQSSARSAKE